MAKALLGPLIVTFCLGGVGFFHFYKSIDKSEYLDANKNVGELLKNENFELLSFGAHQDDIWNEIINKYKDSDEVFEGAPKNDNELIEKLKIECQIVIGKTTKSISTYNKARRWCVVPQKISQRLDIEGRVRLNLKNQKDIDIWWDIVDKYKEKGINGFDIKGEKDKTKLAQAMENGCELLLNTKNWDKDFDSKFEKAKKLCSIKK